MLVNMKQMLSVAKDNHFAVGAFNISESNLVRCVVEAAEANDAPAIIAVHPTELDYCKDDFFKYVIARISNSPVPFVLHMDHGDSIESCMRAIHDGFSSVMIDASSKPFAENIEITKKVVEYAHDHGVVVEAELGTLAGVEDDVKVDAANATYTDPDQAVDFVKRTGVDSLAIAIGTSHGAYKFSGEAKLDFDRLDTITEKLEAAGFHNFPIVLHGASAVDESSVETCNQYGGKIAGAKGVPNEMLRKAASKAVCKINMDTDLRLAMTAAIRKSFGEKPEAFDPRGYCGDARKLIQQLVEMKIKDVLK